MWWWSFESSLYRRIQGFSGCEQDLPCVITIVEHMPHGLNPNSPRLLFLNMVMKLYFIFHNRTKNFIGILDQILFVWGFGFPFTFRLSVIVVHFKVALLLELQSTHKLMNSEDHVLSNWWIRNLTNLEGI